ncbi:MAG: hypothetical protein WCT05_10025, partial [Lentisphaeria bacterium]
TPFFGRFEYHNSPRCEFGIEDCKDTCCEALGSYACVSGPNAVKMLLGTDFSCDYSVDAAAAMTEKYPSLFLQKHDGLPQIVKLQKIIGAGETFRGNLVIVRNGFPETLNKYLEMENPCRFLRGKIRAKYASVSCYTPDAVINASVPDTIIALDAAFHGTSFYHGAIGYHAPFLGWRGWYAPALVGWADRVCSTIESHFATITRSEGAERVWWDGGDRPDLDHEGTQYHHLENSSGHLTALLHRDDIYDMQEVAVDMTLFYLDHSGDLECGERIFERLCEILDWEERILDPDADGLYQNFLNTWISDGHSYNGGACTQASAYNCYANRKTAQLGRKLGKDVAKLEQRAAKIRSAMQSRLWLQKQGVMAEFIDTIGNKLVHPSPELGTLYLAADCETLDARQIFRMSRWVQRNIKSVLTANRKGRLFFSSNWFPKKYSTCGIFPAENACLALAWFRNAQRKEAMEIVEGLADAFSLSPYPGSLSHVLSAMGGADGGDIDFTDVSSCYLRMLFEGLWGIRFRRLEGHIDIAPQLPDEWDRASLSLPEITVQINRTALTDTLTVFLTDVTAEKFIRLPLRYAGIDQVFLNGEEVSYSVVPGFGTSSLEIQTTKTGKIELSVFYRNEEFPSLAQEKMLVYSDGIFEIDLKIGQFLRMEHTDALEILQQSSQKIIVKVKADMAGLYDCFFRVRNADVETILSMEVQIKSLPSPAQRSEAFGNLDCIFLEPYFNCAVSEIHQREFRSPRPAGYSIGARLNGRYAWEWNHYGHNALQVDDSGLRNCGGTITTASGMQFLTPAKGNNALCVSMWDNFPTAIEVPLSGQANEMAVFYCGTTNAMQSYVTNAKLAVLYSDGSSETIELIHPGNFDDFLVPALQKQNETCYIGEGTHGTILRILLNPEKELQSLRAEAVANEVILSILGVTLRRP